MCVDPATLTATQLLWASIATSAASAGVSYVGQKQAANAQAKYQNAQFQAREQQRQDTRQLAVRNAILKQDALNEQMSQKRSATSQKIQATQTKKLKAKAKAFTSGSENNAIGGSLVALLGDFDRQEGVFKAGLNMNQFYAERNIDVQKQGEREIAMGRMASVQPYIPAPVEQPSFMGAMLNVASDSVSSVDLYQRRTNPDYFAKA